MGGQAMNDKNNMEKDKIRQCVDSFLKSRDFQRNEHGAMIYSCGPHSFNARYLLEELLEEWEQSRHPDVIKSVCPSCGAEWDMTKHNACECGASIKS